MSTPITDQWKLDGQCKLCRRSKYCGSVCTAAMRRVKTLANQKINELLLERLEALKKQQAEQSPDTAQSDG